MDRVLTAEKVTQIFRDCLFVEGESTENHVLVEGLQLNIGFNPVKLEKHKEQIVFMLQELPESFQQAGGGGMSFLNACEDKHGYQWTGVHRTMDELFMLGAGINRVKELVPRHICSTLPGGMPYYVVTGMEVKG